MGSSTATTGARRGSRRTVLATALVVTAIVCTAFAGAAGASPCAGGAGGAVDRNGTLRIATDLTTIGGVEVDPSLSRNLQDAWYMSLIYGTLLKPGPTQGSWAPSLAKSYRIVNPSTINVKLRPGLTFQDGKPFTATDVRNSTLRNKAVKNGNLSPDIAQLTDVQVVSPTEMNFVLATPIAGSFLELLAGRETMTASPGTTDQAKAPIGAGPYKLQRYDRGQQMVLVRWDGYVDHKDYRIKTVKIVQAAAGAPSVNALLANQVDVASMDAATADGVKGQPNVDLKSVVSDGSFLYVGMCKDGSFPYFDNVKFRQAINYAIDRNAINDAVLLGKGEPTAQLWPKGSAFYDKSLAPIQKQNVKKAKQLLKQVGVPSGYSINMSVSQSVSSNLTQFAEIVQGELKDVGINVTLKPTPDIVRDFFAGKQTPMSPTLWIRPGLQKLTRQFTPGQAADICNYSDPTLTGYMSQLATLDPSDPQAVAIWKKAQDFIVAKNQLAIYVAFQPQLYAFRTDNVGGTPKLISASGFTPYPDITTLFMKK